MSADNWCHEKSRGQKIPTYTKILPIGNYTSSFLAKLKAVRNLRSWNVDMI